MTTFLNLNVNKTLSIKDDTDGVTDKISLNSSAFTSNVETNLKKYLYVGSDVTYKTLTVNPNHTDSENNLLEVRGGDTGALRLQVTKDFAQADYLKAGSSDFQIDTATIQASNTVDVLTETLTLLEDGASGPTQNLMMLGSFAHTDLRSALVQINPIRSYFKNNVEIAEQLKLGTFFEAVENTTEKQVMLTDGILKVKNDGTNVLQVTGVTDGAKVSISNEGALDANAGFTTSGGYLTVTGTQAKAGTAIDARDAEVKIHDALNANNVGVTVDSTNVTIKRNVDMGLYDLKARDLQCRNFSVTGTMVTKDAQHIVTGDNHIYLNAFGLQEAVGDAGPAEHSGIISACRTRSPYTAVKLDWNGDQTEVILKFADANNIPYWAENNSNYPIIQISGDPAASALSPEQRADRATHPVCGLYQVLKDANSDGALRIVRAGGDPNKPPEVPSEYVPHTFVRTALDNSWLAGGADLTGFRVAIVEVYHLLFNDSASGTDHHGSVKFGHGHNATEFEYDDMMVAGTKRTHLSTAVSTTLETAVTTFTGSTADQTLTLPSSADAGSVFKVINGSTVSVKVSGTLASSSTYVMIAAEGCMSFTYGGDNKWHMM